jgi:exodeoxyribonuclease-3
LARGLGADDDDPDGRVLVTEADGWVVINTYLPSGSADERAQARKDAFCSLYASFLAPWAEDPRPVLVGGDLNIAPTAQDIHDPKGNAKSSGFLPHEREWFASLLGQGWSDLVREALGPGRGPYSWWSNRGQARALDRGWRIDHLLGNRAARARLVGAGVWRAGGLDTSDHAPVWVDLA